MRLSSLLAIASLPLFAITTPAAAQEPDATASADDQSGGSPSGEAQSAPRTRGDDGDDFHIDNTIVITAPYAGDLNILAGTSVLSGDNLTQDLEPQIGEVLAKLPGVSATSFSPGASRPILRGFQGPRVQVLTDGIGTIDVSSTSPDHGVTIEPLLVERIEVVRGPAVLLYGGSAVGGAVNAIDKRIPRSVPDEPIHVDALASYSSVTNERGGGASVDAALRPNLVLHLDGAYRRSDDLEVGGFTLSPNLRAEQFAIAAEETEEGNLDEAAEALDLANLRGTVPNTQTESYNFGGGLSFIGDGGSIGVAVSYLNSDYGVPERPGAGHAGEEMGAEEEGPVTIGLDQIRADFRAEVELPGFFEKLRARAAYADFEQTEFEGDEVGTVFTNTGIEGRLELSQRSRGGWSGAVGVQYVHRDFGAVGAEAFVPPNLTDQFGVFALEEFETGNWDFEAAARYDRVATRAQSLGLDLDFDSFSFALGVGYSITPELKAGVNLSRSERAPSPEELFSNGPHIATQSFEIGDPDFDTERSIGGEAYVRYDGVDFQLSATGFYNNFDNFIIELPTGAEVDGLPVFQFIQNDAEYYGLEFEASSEIAEIGAFSIIADTVADFVHATLDGIGPVPRIPPLRVLGGLEAQSDLLDFRAEVEWFDDQTRTAAFETDTDGFTLVNASASWKPFGRDGGVTLLASANNIFDVVGRRAASFTKDFAPLAGRDFRVTAKVSF